jgi:DNA-binding LytR/AlgR family response regulator
MLSTVHSSGIVNSMIRITGIGDRDLPEWLIRISGMRMVDLQLQPRTPNGLAVARMARRHRPGLPIIFVTGHAELAEHTDPEMGPVMLKPVNLDLLVSNAGERLKAP